MKPNAHDEAEKGYLETLNSLAVRSKVGALELGGWIAAQRATGVLAPGCPTWKLVAAAALLQRDLGWLLEVTRRMELEREEGGGKGYFRPSQS